MAGFTPMSTTSADAAASALPSARSSRAMLVTPSRPASSAGLLARAIGDRDAGRREARSHQPLEDRTAHGAGSEDGDGREGDEVGRHGAILRFGVACGEPLPSRDARPPESPFRPHAGGAMLVSGEGRSGSSRTHRRTAMTLFPGITQRALDVPGLAVGILEREGDDQNADPAKTVVFVHGNVSSSLFWMPTMLDLPRDLRVIAIDLRGYGAHGARSGRRDARRARLQRRHPRDPRAAGHPDRPSRRLVARRGGRDAVRARSPGAQPHPGGARLAVRLRRHASRRLAADR